MIQYATSECGGETCVTIYNGDERYHCSFDEIDHIAMKEALNAMNGSSIQGKVLGDFAVCIGLQVNKALPLFATIHRVRRHLESLIAGLCLRSIYLRIGVYGLEFPIEVIRDVGLVVHLGGKSYQVDKKRFLFPISEGKTPVIDTTHISNGVAVHCSLFKNIK